MRKIKYFIAILLGGVPECEGHKSWTDCGYEYSCGYNNEDVECGTCLCNVEHNGRIDPRNGKRVFVLHKLI